VNRGWLSPGRAEEVCRVKLRLARNGIDYEIDRRETARRRGRDAEGRVSAEAGDSPPNPRIG